MAWGRGWHSPPLPSPSTRSGRLSCLADSVPEYLSSSFSLPLSFANFSPSLFSISITLWVCVCLSVSPPLSLALSPSGSLSSPLPQVARTFDPATAFVVDDLKPNTEYAFRLAARSPQGLGAFTSVVRQRTLQSSRCLSDPALTCGGDLAGAFALTRAGPAQGWGAPWPIPPAPPPPAHENPC